MYHKSVLFVVAFVNCHLSLYYLPLIKLPKFLYHLSLYNDVRQAKVLFSKLNVELFASMQ